jgi:GntP family gluconate:H+ symporter
LDNAVIRSTVAFIGHPVVALLIGVFLSFALKSRLVDGSYLDWVAAGLQNAGVIILITGAGGAFGQVLRATDLGDRIGDLLSDANLGILLPFAIAAILKTAQGSSTVALLTTSALVAPLLPSLGLEAPLARALTVLAVGAGSMTVSHVNDSYFWVVSQFSDMNTATALRCFTLATLLQGLCAMATIMLLVRLFV